MLRRTAALALLLPLACVLPTALPAGADTHTVCTMISPICQYTNIQAAINAAADGDTVLVRDGTYLQRFSLPTTRSITLVSQNGAASTIIDGTGQPTELVAFLNGSVPSTFQGFTVRNGSFGGITVANTSPAIRDCVIEGNDHDNGGGIYISGGSPAISGCVFANNTATAGGGGLYSTGGSPVLANCTFSGNMATLDGGGIRLADSPSASLSGCAFDQNTAGGSGGGLHCTNSSPILAGCVFSGNSATADGGGFYAMGGSPALAGSTFSGNTAGAFGGGMRLRDGSPSLSGCTFTGNAADDGGGAEVNDSPSATFTGCTFDHNAADHQGGGLNVTMGARLTDCVFNANSAVSGQAGGASLAGGTPVLENCSFTGNSSQTAVGGAMVQECFAALVAGCSFTGNSAMALGGLGAMGVISLDLRDTVIEGNTASVYYGGLFLMEVGGTIRNCVIRDNDGGAHSGGVFIAATSDMQLLPEMRECVVTGNSAASHGGIMVSGNSTADSTLRLTNLLIAGNKSGGLSASKANLIMLQTTVADNYGGGIALQQADLLAVNSIVWGNATLGLAGELEVTEEPSNVAITYSDVKGGWPGTGNIARKPRFLKSVANGLAPSSDGDYRVWKGRTIDRGASYGAPVTDLLGNLRPQRRGFDMGAYEEGALKNGHLEGTAVVPVPWVGMNLAAADRRVSAEAMEGKSSFRLTGSTLPKSLSQAIKMSGTGGSTLRLTGWSKADAVPPNGAYGIYLTVRYVVGGAKTYKLQFTRGSHDWEQQAAAIVAEEDFTSLKVRLRYACPAGTAWFDGVELFVE